jgi:hypothetical protein
MRPFLKDDPTADDNKDSTASAPPDGFIHPAEQTPGSENHVSKNLFFHIAE